MLTSDDGLSKLLSLNTDHNSPLACISMLSVGFTGALGILTDGPDDSRNKAPSCLLILIYPYRFKPVLPLRRSGVVAHNCGYKYRI